MGDPNATNPNATNANLAALLTGCYIFDWLVKLGSFDLLIDETDQAPYPLIPGPV